MKKKSKNQDRIKRKQFISNLLPQKLQGTLQRAPNVQGHNSNVEKRE